LFLILRSVHGKNKWLAHYPLGHCPLILIQGQGHSFTIAHSITVASITARAAAVHCHCIVADHSLVRVAHQHFYSPSSVSFGAYFYFHDFAFALHCTTTPSHPIHIL
jgi:hypothetical protein